MAVPQWVKEAVFYQIFPDRFANGDPTNDPLNVQPWGVKPTIRGFQGGDLKGILQKIDYLLDLGINAIYLNPIFMSPSTHRYNTTDYFRIEPMLGDMNDFHALVETAHRTNIRVILDGVFNHCGRGFFAFNDVLENEKDSPYRDWFYIKRFPVNAYSPGEATRYQAWWQIKSLPKFNTDNRQVREYLLSVARYWIEQGADGWRLDVPNEIDDDSFWAEFWHVVKTANTEAYLLGEIWDVNPRWVGDGHFDGLMNYPLRTAVFQYLTGELTSARFGERIEELLTVYPDENRYAMLNLLSSHDTERALTFLGGDLNKLKLAMLFQFAYPGTPSVYYGDEIGMTGGKDPDCRKAFPWESGRWNTDLREWVKSLTAQRRSLPEMREGDYQRLFTQETPKAFAFARTLGEEKTLVVMNASADKTQLILPVERLKLQENQVLHNLLGTQQTVVQQGKVTLTLEPFTGVWLK